MFGRKFARFDTYAKSMEGVYEKTLCGGLLTIFSLILMTTLLITEFMHYKEIHTSYDAVPALIQTSNQLNMSISLKFPTLSCADVNMDIEDKDGNHQLSVENLNKTSYTPTLDELHFINNSITYDNYLQSTKVVGCIVNGNVALDKFPGTFDFSLGTGVSWGTTHEHRYSLEQLKHYNPSHYITQLRFGDQLQSLNNSLENVYEYQNASFHKLYSMIIIPTIYTDINGNVIYTYQYTHTHHVHILSTTGDNVLKPGIYFKYEFSPVQLNISEYHYNILEFILSICGILGGIFTCFGLFDSFFYQSSEYLNKID